MALQRKKIYELPDELEPDLGDFVPLDADQGGLTYLTRRVNVGDFPIIPFFSRWQNGLYNVGIDATVAANALTISLKQDDGTTNPTTGRGKVRAKFRSSTLTSGAVVTRDGIAAITTTISSGSTLGFTNGVTGYIYVYLLDNAGTLEICYSGSDCWNEGNLNTTTAEGGAGAADSRTVLYSTTARSNVAIRYVGKIRISEATAGTWATAHTAIIPHSVVKSIGSSVTLRNGNGHGSTNTKIRRYTNSSIVGVDMSYSDSATLGASITINEDGYYAISSIDAFSGGTAAMGASVNSNQLTTNIDSITLTNLLFAAVAATNATGSGSITVKLSIGDIVRPHDNGNPDNTANFVMFNITKIG